MPLVTASKVRAEDCAHGLLVDVYDIEGGAALASQALTLDVDTGNTKLRLHDIRVQVTRGVRTNDHVTIDFWTAFVRKIEVLP